MKKWNNPELLNLILQETKTDTEEQSLDEFLQYIGHTCYKSGEPHACNSGSRYSDGKETCFNNFNRHSNFKYERIGRFNNLVSCCSES